MMKTRFTPEEIAALRAKEEKYLAHNYHPIDVWPTEGKAAELTDAFGKTYIDMMGAYSAVSHGHLHPKIIAAVKDQLDHLTNTSRAFHIINLALLAEKLSKLTGMDRILPCNGGSESVETTIKGVRKWGYDVKRIPANEAVILVAKGNFHGRTVTISGFSTEDENRKGFGPFAPGFELVPYGDAAAVEAAIARRPEKIAGIIVEPIQGEAGIIVPPEDYLPQLRAITQRHNVLLIVDEIQTGLGRTGKDFAYMHYLSKENRPDGVIVGKALGGGILPVSAFCATDEVMGVFTPGIHGSTFGGGQFANAAAIAALDVLVEEKLSEQSAEKGAYFMGKLQEMVKPYAKYAVVRGKGLFIGLEVKNGITGKEMRQKVVGKGVLTKETHDTTLRFAPPLTVTRGQIDRTVEVLKASLQELIQEKNFPL